MNNPAIYRVSPLSAMGMILKSYKPNYEANRQTSRKATISDSWTIARNDFLRPFKMALKGKSIFLLPFQLALKGDLVSAPLSLCVNQYAFSYKKGWHYFRDLATELIHEPGIPLQETRFYKFFQRCQCPTYTQLMTFHCEDMNGAFPELPFGSYPWGNFDQKVVIDPYQFRDTSEVRRTQQFMWFETGTTIDDVLHKEYSRIATLLNSIQSNGYRISMSRYRFPKATMLMNRSGEARFIQQDGAHRLSVLSALGYERVVVQLNSYYHPAMLEENIADWPYVQGGLVSQSTALRFFQLYFTLDGTERAKALGCL
ncbi:MAG: hypothetical protein GY805_03360 [Chloroflexi bacterium]|nr:hypothetical protein [Chloroflexota bacterium]